MVRACRRWVKRRMRRLSAPFVVEQPVYVPDEVVEEEEPARSPLRRPLVVGGAIRVL